MTDINFELTEFFNNTPEGKIQMLSIVKSRNANFILNIDELYSSNPQLAEELLNGGISVIAELEDVVRDILTTIYGFPSTTLVHAGMSGEKIPTVMVHNLSVSHVSQVVKISGLIARSSVRIRPVYSKAVF